MHLSFLIFTSLLLSFTFAIDESKIPESLYAGFKHLNGKEFAMQLEHGAPHQPNYSPYMTNIVMCKFSYCHGEDREDCGDLCAETGHKFNDIIIEKRLKKLDSRKQPDASQEECEKECAIDCGKNDCKAECSTFCRIHWSYENRKEYEAEFYEFLIKLKAVRGV